MKKIEAFKNGQKMRDLVTLIQTSHFSPKNQSDWKIIKSKIFELFAQKIVENIVEFSDKKVYKTSV